MSLAGIVLIAAGVIVGTLAVFELLARLAHARFLSTVILGADGRTSTSKTFILLWTLLFGWALIALLIEGQFVQTHHCVVLADPTRACTGDELGLFQVGWRHFLNAGLSGSYLILLGVPATAGVAAKAITQSQVTGTGFKKPNPSDGPNPFARVAEVFSADDGTADVGDFQYVIFNLVTATYFLTQFLNPDGTGLPIIPDTLLGLTSVSAGLYVAKKAVTKTQPTVTGVFPQPLHDGQPYRDRNGPDGRSDVTDERRAANRDRRHAGRIRRAERRHPRRKSPAHCGGGRDADRPSAARAQPLWRDCRRLPRPMHVARPIPTAKPPGRRGGRASAGKGVT